MHFWNYIFLPFFLNLLDLKKKKHIFFLSSGFTLLFKVWLISVLVDFTAASTQRWMENIGGSAWFTQGHHTASQRERFLEPRKGKPKQKPKRWWNHTLWCPYMHAETHPHDRLHTKCAFWIKCEKKFLSVTFHWGWKDTNRQLFFPFCF